MLESATAVGATPARSKTSLQNNVPVPNHALQTPPRVFRPAPRSGGRMVFGTPSPRVSRKSLGGAAGGEEGDESRGNSASEVEMVADGGAAVFGAFGGLMSPIPQLLEEDLTPVRGAGAFYMPTPVLVTPGLTPKSGPFSNIADAEVRRQHVLRLDVDLRDGRDEVFRKGSTGSADDDDEPVSSDSPSSGAELGVFRTPWDRVAVAEKKASRKKRRRNSAGERAGGRGGRERVGGCGVGREGEEDLGEGHEDSLLVPVHSRQRSEPVLGSRGAGDGAMAGSRKARPFCAPYLMKETVQGNEQDDVPFPSRSRAPRRNTFAERVRTELVASAPGPGLPGLGGRRRASVSPALPDVGGYTPSPRHHMHTPPKSQLLLSSKSLGLSGKPLAGVSGGAVSAQELYTRHALRPAPKLLLSSSGAAVVQGGEREPLHAVWPGRAASATTIMQHREEAPPELQADGLLHSAATRIPMSKTRPDESFVCDSAGRHKNPLPTPHWPRPEAGGSLFPPRTATGAGARDSRYHGHSPLYEQNAVVDDIDNIVSPTRYAVTK